MSLDPLLLQMLGNNGNTEQPSPLLDMLQNQDSLSPKAQMLLKIMSANQPDHDDVIDIEPKEDEPHKGYKRLRHKIYVLQNELDEAQEMLDVLAESIGCCPVCFGGQDDCRECHGRGISGWKKPDPELFSHFIVPAIRRIKQHSSHAKKSAQTVRHDSDDEITNQPSIMQKGDYDV